MAVNNIILISTVVFAGIFALTSSAAIESKDSQTQLVSTSGSNWSFYNIAALGTAVLVVGAGLAAVMSLFVPVMMFKLCLMLGGCQDAIDSYVVGLLGEGYPSERQKRSMEYIEPILNTLASAYEKYADNDVKKKSNRLRF